MAFESAVRMPGAFQADGIHHGLFRPPVSSASPSAYLATARTFPASIDAVTPKRRRNLRSGGDTPWRADLDDDAAPANMLGSPATILPRQPVYALAGQLDTPGSGLDDSGVLGESMYSDSNYRRALGSKRPRQDVDMPDPSRPTPLFSLPDKPAPPRTWSAAAFTTIGGVVGKVWEFCRAGAFRGFYAGGGRGYDVNVGDQSALDASRCSGGQADEWRLSERFPHAIHRSSIPMCIADRDRQLDDDEAAYADDTRASTPSAPAAKRRQTAPTDEIGRNWVMVKEPRAGDRRQSCQRPLTRTRHHGPPGATTRRISTPSSRKASDLAPRRQSSRLHAAAAPSLPVPEPPRSSSSASFASPRSASPTKKASCSRIALATSASVASPPSHGHAHRRSVHASPGHATLSHRRTHSNASTASSRAGATAVDELNASPRLNAEAKQLAARRKMEEHDADVRIEAFNKRLQDMIRQGKEALGTSIEIAGGDGGWEDEE
ncbi:hypothetical protein HRG_008162 [Hirsutella rhossiliensis]|uniref:Uncharacterized protein n=1 Tax=Hirsutella rhossiliensis TaxID=111463 RepID=A0A9P8SGD3_9HYPO|nr:uncharacterized protein HRG_08162 [Hirsutella rhossiliensis]KAH0961009.1 hypothetical protein HRG_08162 [Hirsutella rhossiliensis]